VLNGASVELLDAVALVRQVSGRPTHVLRLPRIVARVAGGVAGIVARVSGRDLPLCPEVARTLLHGHRYDGSFAEHDLGLRYRPLETTVRRALAWYAERGLIAPLRPADGSDVG
jgi:dihydroflavonol-4-reductase